MKIIEEGSEDPILMLDTRDCHHLALELSTHFINRDKYEILHPIFIALMQVAGKYNEPKGKDE